MGGCLGVNLVVLDMLNTRLKLLAEEGGEIRGPSLSYNGLGSRILVFGPTAFALQSVLGGAFGGGQEIAAVSTKYQGSNGSHGGNGQL